MEVIEIRIREQIDPDWSDWLDDVSITHAGNGETLLTGRLRDQSSLRGLLEGLFDLNLQLASLVSRRADMSEEVEGCED